MNTHLITGASGQDGVLLARRLMARGEAIVAASHGPASRSLLELGAEHVPLDVTNPRKFRELVEKCTPDVVHNLAAQSSVAASWTDPESSELINHRAVVEMLEVLLTASPKTRFVQASSSEIFGAAPGPVANEDTPKSPQSPYAEAKARAHDAVIEARDSGLHATNLILFGHTSTLQSPRFVLPSICRQAVAVRLGKSASIQLQDPGISRDWGSADDYMRAFELAASGPANDYIVATGTLTSLREVATWALGFVDRSDAPIETTGPSRPQDHDGLRGDFLRARTALGWQPATALQTQIEAMVDHLLTKS